MFETSFGEKIWKGDDKKRKVSEKKKEIDKKRLRENQS